MENKEKRLVKNDIATRADGFKVYQLFFFLNQAFILHLKLFSALCHFNHQNVLYYMLLPHLTSLNVTQIIKVWRPHHYQ